MPAETAKAEWQKTACILCSLNCGIEVQVGGPVEFDIFEGETFFSGKSIAYSLKSAFKIRDIGGVPCGLHPETYGGSPDIEMILRNLADRRPDIGRNLDFRQRAIGLQASRELALDRGLSDIEKVVGNPFDLSLEIG